jgi:hypothetical protein
MPVWGRYLIAVASEGIPKLALEVCCEFWIVNFDHANLP